MAEALRRVPRLEGSVSRLFSVARLRCSNISHLSFFVLALTLGCAGAASADTWSAGNVITCGQADWAAGCGARLGADFDTVYAGSFSVTVGLPNPGFSMTFDGASHVQAYLPAAGVAGPLDATLGNPTSSSSGEFGGSVLALELNVDFSDAGFLLGTSGIPFGNLVLTNFNTLPGLNGLTVRQFLAIDNTALGGGSTVYTIANLDSVTFDVNSSFLGGTPSSFAQNYLLAPASVTSTPEPGSLLLLGTGLLGLIGAARRKWLA